MDLFFEKDFLFQYLRNKDNSKRGIMVAIVEPTTKYVVFGYSVCNKVDKFDLDKAFAISVGRAAKYMDYSVLDMDDMIPFSIRKDLFLFIARCKRYFKDKELTPWAYNILIECGYMDNEGNILVNAKGELLDDE